MLSGDVPMYLPPVYFGAIASGTGATPYGFLGSVLKYRGNCSSNFFAIFRACFKSSSGVLA